MIPSRPLTPGFLAAILHRLSGIALALFLPLHFIALATALKGADGLQSFLALTHNAVATIAEWGLVTSLALHMALGLRVLVIEWFRLAGENGRRRLQLPRRVRSDRPALSVESNLKRYIDSQPQPQRGGDDHAARHA